MRAAAPAPAVGASHHEAFSRRSGAGVSSSFLSMIGFAVTMYITPGPNNAMLAASAASFGIRATIPHVLGIAFGFTFMLTAVCSGLGATLLAWPLLEQI